MRNIPSLSPALFKITEEHLHCRHSQFFKFFYVLYPVPYVVVGIDRHLKNDLVSDLIYTFTKLFLRKLIYRVKGCDIRSLFRCLTVEACRTVTEACDLLFHIAVRQQEHFTVFIDISSPRHYTAEIHSHNISTPFHVICGVVFWGRADDIRPYNGFIMFVRLLEDGQWPSLQCSVCVCCGLSGTPAPTNSIHCSLLTAHGV